MEETNRSLTVLFTVIFSCVILGATGWMIHMFTTAQDSGFNQLVAAQAEYSYDYLDVYDRTTLTFATAESFVLEMMAREDGLTFVFEYPSGARQVFGPRDYIRPAGATIDQAVRYTGPIAIAAPLEYGRGQPADIVRIYPKHADATVRAETLAWWVAGDPAPAGGRNVRTINAETLFTMLVIKDAGGTVRGLHFVAEA